MHVLVDALRVLKVLDHDLAALQARLAEANLEDLNILDLTR